MRVLREIVLASAMLSTAVSAAEIEFSVEAPINLMLTISGYAADGAQLFSSTTNQFREKDGSTFYSLVVDDSTFPGPLAKWCVIDITRKWDAIPADASSLCDETLGRKGTAYVFSGVPVMPEPAPVPVGPVVEAPSETEQIACVQAALNELGYNAGAPDGLIGNGTRRAFESFIKGTEGKISARWSLDERSSRVFCLYMAREHELAPEVEEVAERLAATSEAIFWLRMPQSAFQSFALVDESQNALGRTESFTEFKVPSTGEVRVRVALPYAPAQEAIGYCSYVNDGWVFRNKEGKGFKGSCGRLDPVFATLGMGIDFTVEEGEPG